jgi:hypothetical protein
MSPAGKIAPMGLRTVAVALWCFQKVSQSTDIYWVCAGSHEEADSVVIGAALGELSIRQVSVWALKDLGVEEKSVSRNAH